MYVYRWVYMHITFNEYIYKKGHCQSALSVSLYIYICIHTDKGFGSSFRGRPRALLITPCALCVARTPSPCPPRLPGVAEDGNSVQGHVGTFGLPVEKGGQGP